MIVQNVIIIIFEDMIYSYHMISHSKRCSQALGVLAP